MEQACQGEMSQMVNPELLLESLSGPSEWRDHDPSVQDEPIESVMCPDDVTGCVPDPIEIAEIEVLERDGALGVLCSKTLDGRLALPFVSGTKKDLRTCMDEPSRCLEPDARVGPRDEDASSYGGGEIAWIPASHGRLLMVMGINPRSITEQRFVDGFGEIA